MLPPAQYLKVLLKRLCVGRSAIKIRTAKVFVHYRDILRAINHKAPAAAQIRACFAVAQAGQ
jgi:hypothetical protein